MRIVGFERRVAIGFVVRADRVVIGRILYGGRDLDRQAWDESPDDDA